MARGGCRTDDGARVTAREGGGSPLYMGRRHAGSPSWRGPGAHRLATGCSRGRPARWAQRPPSHGAGSQMPRCERGLGQRALGRRDSGLGKARSGARAEVRRYGAAGAKRARATRDVAARRGAGVGQPVP
jgi:hypothetical protein